MNKNRLFTLGITGAIALVAILGWFVGISPVLDQAAATGEQVSSAAGINDINQAKLVTLKKQFANIGEVQNELTGLRQSLPVVADMPDFLREINEFGAAHNVSLTSVTVSPPTPYEASPATAAASTPAEGSTPTPSPSASASATATAGTTSAPPAAGSGLVVIPVQIVVTGSYADVLAFVGAIQGGPRLLLVQTFAMTGNEGSFTGSIAADIYALPTTAPAAASTTP